MTETREKIDYNMREMYAYYRKTRQNAKNYEVFSKVVKLFNQKMLQHVYEADYLTLPFKLGDIYIKKYKPKYKFTEEGEIDTFNQYGLIDYKATKELWKQFPELEHKQRVVYTNEHTDGFKFKIYWRRGNVRNITVYIFRPSRKFKRGAAKYIMSNPNQDYYDN